MTGHGRTARLAIEAIADEHAEGLVAALAHPEVSEHLPAPAATTVDAMRAWIARVQTMAPAGERWVNFAVRRDGLVIGRIEATVHDRWAEIAYLFGPPYQRHGYAREAVRWLIDHLAELGVNELWACIHPQNSRSVGLVEHLGFSRVGPRRDLASYDAGDLTFARWGTFPRDGAHQRALREASSELPVSGDRSSGPRVPGEASRRPRHPAGDR